MFLPLIGVIGAGQCDDTTRQIAFDVGKLIAQNKFGLVCGGLGGVMEAAAEGCQSQGGTTVGIIPQDDVKFANPYITIVIPAGMGIMRNLLVVRSAKGIIAVGGRYGTLSEIAFALQLNKPIVGINTWEISKELKQYPDAQTAVLNLIDKL